MDYRRGIDVSYHQGNIDWASVKASGVEFAMLRAGYGQGNIDKKFHEYAKECTRLGIPFGVYWFSYAYNLTMAHTEAQHVLGAVAPYKLSYPIAFDFEYDSVNYAKKQGVTVTKAMATSFAHEFCRTVQAARKMPMVYTNPDYLANYFDATIPKSYDIWLAKWPKTPDFDNPPEHAALWQYTSSGTVPGISGRVDMNVDYKYYTEDDENMTVEKFAELMDEYRERLQREEESKWAKDDGSWDWAKRKGLIKGDDRGLDMPHDFVTREQMAALFHRYDKQK